MFTESMVNKAQAVKPHPNEGAHGAYNLFCSFFYNVDSTAMADNIVIGDLELPKKSPYF